MLQNLCYFVHLISISYQQLFINGHNLSQGLKFNRYAKSIFPTLADESHGGGGEGELRAPFFSGFFSHLRANIPACLLACSATRCGNKKQSKLLQKLPKQLLDTQVVLKRDVFQNSPKCREIFGLLL